MGGLRSLDDVLTHSPGNLAFHVYREVCGGGVDPRWLPHEDS